MKQFIFLFLGLCTGIDSYAQSLALEKTNEGAWVMEDGEKALFYQAKTKSMDGKYPRANYIHPLYNVDGYELTEDFPRDHLHHRGIFWTWHQVVIDDKHIGDAWECRDFIWDVVEFGEAKSTENSLTLSAKTLWKSPLWKNSNGNLAPFVEEHSNITIYGKKANYRVIDFEISLLAMVENLAIGGSDNEKGYGGFSVRMKLPKDIKFTSSRGIEEPVTTQIDGASWMNISGTLSANGSKGGVVIINHNKNAHYPEKWILRKKGSMQNPVFPGRHPYILSTTNPTILKYRLLVYTGSVTDEFIKEIEADFN